MKLFFLPLLGFIIGILVAILDQPFETKLCLTSATGIVLTLLASDEKKVGK